jgi:hypothetical protein
LWVWYRRLAASSFCNLDMLGSPIFLVTDPLLLYVGLVPALGGLLLLRLGHAGLARLLGRRLVLLAQPLLKLLLQNHNLAILSLIIGLFW